MSNLRKILPLAVIAIMVMMLCASAKPALDDSRRRAGYLFREAMNLNADGAGDLDVVRDLLRRAHELDSANTAIAFYYGLYNLSGTFSANWKDGIDRNLALMRRHLEQHPADYDEASIYASLCQGFGRYDEAIAVRRRLINDFPSKTDMKYEIVESYAANGDYDEAIAMCDSIELHEGLTYPVSTSKASFRLLKGDTTGGLNELRRLLATAPDNVAFNNALATMFMHIDRPDSALTYFNRMEAIEPRNGQVALSKANYYVAIGDSAGYDKQIYRVLTNDDVPVDNKLEVIKGYVGRLFHEGDTASPRIVGLFHTLQEQHPLEPGINRLFSDYLAINERYDEGAEQMEAVVAMDPSNEDDWQRLMALYIQGNDTVAALRASDRALQYHPNSGTLLRYTAIVYIIKENYPAALAMNQRCLAVADSADYERRSDILCSIADCQSRLGDTIQALNCYEQAVTLNPANLLALNNYAYYLTETDGDLDRAERMSAITIKNSDPKNATYLDTYAWVFFKKRDYTLARMYIEQAIATAEEQGEELTADFFEHYGDILFMQGEPEKALEQWRRALELEPSREILQRKVEHKTYFYK